MKINFIIPARGGSKGLPGKNIKPLNGKPLIAYSIDHAKKCKFDHEIFVSTDCDEIARVSMEYGAKVIRRPSEISGDTATSESALLHALNELEAQGKNADLIVFLQCTSPIREDNDINAAIDLLITENSDSLLSASPNHRFIWKKTEAGFNAINYDYKNRKRRQDLEPEYVENGSIYIFKPWVLKNLNNRLGGKISLYCMKEEAAFEIDSSFDFFVIENLIKGNM